MKIAIIICDDNALFVQELEKLIKECMEGIFSPYELIPFMSGGSLLDAMRGGLSPDIIFLDIDLKEDALGTDLGVEIKKMNYNILLIYVSAYSCYYEKIIQAEPFGFIDKPIEKDELKYVLTRAIERLLAINQDCIFQYKLSGMVGRVNLRDVRYFESDHRIIKIHDISGNEHQFYGRLDDVEKEIEEMYKLFLRPCKSFYVNYNHVDKISNTYVFMDGMKLKISKMYKKRLDEKMFLMLKFF